MIGATSSPPREARHLHHGERGQSLLEFTFILPIFLILVFGIVDFGLALRAYVTVTNAAREGARYGIVCPATDDAIRQRAVDHSGSLLALTDVTVAWPAGRCKSEELVEVTAKHDFAFVTPLGSFLALVLDDIEISSTTRMRVE